jgi:hypothetical protein
MGEPGLVRRWTGANAEADPVVAGMVITLTPKGLPSACPSGAASVRSDD